MICSDRSNNGRLGRSPRISPRSRSAACSPSRRPAPGWAAPPPHGYDLRYETDRGEFLFTLRFMPDGSKRAVRPVEPARPLAPQGRASQGHQAGPAVLVPSDCERVETIQSIFRSTQRRSGGLAAISSHLNRECVPTPRGPGWARIYSCEWRDSTVRSILINPIYCGDMVWNRRTDGRFHRIERTESGAGRPVERRNIHGARLVPNDRTDWVVVRDTHEPLVSEGRGGSLRRSGRVAIASPSRRPAQGGGFRGVGGWERSAGEVHPLRPGHLWPLRRPVPGRHSDEGPPASRWHKGQDAVLRLRQLHRQGSVGVHVRPRTPGLTRSLCGLAVLSHYRDLYGGIGGIERLAEAVRAHLGCEVRDVTKAVRMLDGQREQVDSKIAHLLDSMTPATRDLTEERLGELRRERRELEARRAELDRLTLRDAEVHDLVDEISDFLAGLGTHSTRAATSVGRRRCDGACGACASKGAPRSSRSGMCPRVEAAARRTR
jgi:hypothetical protein